LKNPEKILRLSVLGKDQIIEIKRLSYKLGLGYTSLIRFWVTERLAKIHSIQHY